MSGDLERADPTSGKLKVGQIGQRGPDRIGLLRCNKIGENGGQRLKTKAPLREVAHQTAFDTVGEAGDAQYGFSRQNLMVLKNVELVLSRC